MNHLQDLHVLILGLGASGLAMARWCARHGATVTVADTRESPPQLAALRAEVPDAAFVGGAFTAALVEGTPIRAVYRSPGLAPASVAVVVDAARAVGLAVGGELDLFVRALADLRTADAIGIIDAAEDPAGDDTVPAVHDAARDAQQGETPVSDALHDSHARQAEAEAEADAIDDDDLPDAPILVLVAAPPSPQGYVPKILAVTGTNGKTTVTALAGQLVACADKTVAVAGNIGPTLLDTLAAHIDANTLPEVWVLELSSFQLDGVQGFEPTAAAVLNLSQDHLDWHGDMAAYGAAKARVFGALGTMVLNREDPAVMAMMPPKAKLPRGQVARSVITFGGELPLRPGDYGIERINGMGWLVRALEADETQKRKRGAAVEEEEIFIQRLMPANALRIRGRHNALNALAALALATAAGCQLAPMLYGLREYRGEPHRVDPVAIVDEVEFFDDSKGTNVGATVAALTSLGEERRVVVILGGDGKGQDFGPLAAPVREFARAVVLIGRDAPLIEAAAGVDRRIPDSRSDPARGGHARGEPCAPWRRGLAVAGLRQLRHVRQLRPSRRRFLRSRPGARRIAAQKRKARKEPRNERIGRSR